MRLIRRMDCRFESDSIYELRARVTQTLNLLKLSPEIEKRILALPDEEAAFFSERRLRPLTQAASREAQLEAFRESV